MKIVVDDEGKKAIQVLCDSHLKSDPGFNAFKDVHFVMSAIKTDEEKGKETE